jgi:hypothetical protein
MATTPPTPPTPDQPTQESAARSYRGYGLPNLPTEARLPIPGNAEFALYALLEFVFILVWIIADSFDTNAWVTVTTALTIGYFISRGIAKASRVLEQ